MNRFKNEVSMRAQVFSARRHKEESTSDKQTAEKLDLLKGFKFRHDFNQNYGNYTIQIYLFLTINFK